MAQIVETYLFQAIPFQQQSEVLCYKIGLQQMSHWINTDIIQVVLSVISPKGLLVLYLRFFNLTEQLFERRNEWKCPIAGGCFCSILLNYLCVPVECCLYHGMINADRFPLKVDGAPF